jgi:hypothetical protein
MIFMWEWSRFISDTFGPERAFVMMGIGIVLYIVWVNERLNKK